MHKISDKTVFSGRFWFANTYAAYPKELFFRIMKTPSQSITIKERRCYECLIIKPLYDFYKNKSKTLGRDYRCKDCFRQYAKTSIKRKEWFAENKKSLRDGWKKWYIKNKEQWKVNYMVSVAIKKGLLKKQPCSVCKRTPVHAHHEDYSKPLDVVWYCTEHHGMRHRLGYIPVSEIEGGERTTHQPLGFGNTALSHQLIRTES